jgi:glycosyltransferase involved in cell wall biosynthesis
MLAELRLRQGIARPSRATNPRFTVIIRTHSRPAKLRLALNSLAMQRADFEVIVVNDGGDDVSALVSHFEAHFPVRYIAFETPRSPSEASNAALAAMRGEYFIHLDDDDIVYPHHLASLDDLTRCHPDARVLYANWSRVLMREQNGVLNSVQRIYPPLWTFNRDSLLHSNFITIHASLFHRDMLQRIGEYEPSLRILQDWEYLIRASKCYDFVPLSRFTCEYRIYADISNSIVSKQQRALDEMKQIFAMHPTTNVAVNAQRAINIQAHQNQVNRIERLHEQVRAGTLSQESANAQILHMVTGFAIEENSARTALAAR